MKRLTTNCPDSNLDAALNLFYIKDFETWVRGGGDGPDYPDIRLYDFIRKAAKILLPDLDFPMDDDGVDYAMGEFLLDGPDEPTGLLALLYTAAWSYAELRGRLMQYEDTGKTPVEVSTLVKDWNDLCTIVRECGGISRVRVLAEADKDGRVDGDTLANIAEEIADVGIMLDQMAIEFEVEDAVAEQRASKVRRLRERMENDA